MLQGRLGKAVIPPMASTKRPCYVIELPTGVMVPTAGGRLIEATVRLGIKQSRGSAEDLQKKYPGAIVVKGFVETQ
jgi:hypothetical protein